MELSVGESVIHPRYGIGQITGTKHQELVEGFDDYCVIEIPNKRLTLHIPTSRLDELGVRPVMPKAKLDHVLDTLRSAPSTLPEDIKQRQQGLQEKLATGLPIPVAEVVRDLTWHKHLAHLTKADSDLLAWGQELLAAEMALVTNTGVTEANQRINAALILTTANEADAGII